MNRRTAVVVLAIGAVGVAGLSPAFAAPGRSKAKALKGTFSYTDVTPDPTVTTSSNVSTHCSGKLPSAPSDVNSHPLKLRGRGTLTVSGNVVGDWAMQIRDAKGNVITGDDANPPATEGILLTISKPGTYQVVMCNLEGAPTASADYTFKPR